MLKHQSDDLCWRQALGLCHTANPCPWSSELREEMDSAATFSCHSFSGVLRGGREMLAAQVNRSAP